MIDLDAKSLKLCLRRIKNPFWKSVLEAWLDYYGSCKLEVDVQDVLKMPVWNTYFTTHNNMRIFGKKLHKNGCKRVRDLIDEHSLDFYSLETFVNRYNVKCNFLDYSTLKGNIPLHYKSLLKHITKEDIVSTLDEYRVHIKETD